MKKDLLTKVASVIMIQAILGGTMTNTVLAVEMPKFIGQATKTSVISKAQEPSNNIKSRILSKSTETKLGEALVTEDGFEYEINRDGETVTISKYTGTETKVTIPQKIGKYTVITIETYAFSGCNSIENIIISEGVLDIKYGAFTSCKNLKSVHLPNSLITIGQNLFTGCSNMTSIVIPKNLKSLDASIFKGCTSLKDIYISEDSQYMTNIDGVIYSKNKTKLYLYPAGKQGTTYRILEGVKEICNNAFYGSKYLTNVVIPNSVTHIDNSAFTNCTGLTGVDLPKNLQSILTGAFQGCTNLKKIEIPDTVTDISSKAFQDCANLEEIVLPNGITEIDEGLLAGCKKLIKVIIPNTVKKIRNHVFGNCSSLTEVIIPESVTQIGAYAFYGCSNLKEILIPGNITEIREYTFYGCDKLTEFIIPRDTTKIGEYAFYGCSKLTEIIVPGNVTEIKEYAFYECNNLTEIVIPKSTTKLENIIKKENAENITIICATGTAAEIYAKENNIKYIVDNESPIVNLSYNANGKTNNVVTISANEKLQEVEGWKLVEDRKSMTKTYTANETEIVTVKDLAGNTATATVKVNNIINEIIELGDLNGDNKVSVTDLLMMKRKIVGMTETTKDDLKAGDMNGDGKITVTDLLMLKRKIVGQT